MTKAGRNLPTATAGLESLGTFAANMQLFAQHGYTHFNTSAREELALYGFFRRLAPQGLRQNVHPTMQQSFT